MTYTQTDLMQELPISSAKIKTTDLPFPRERKQQTISIQIEDYVNAFVVNDANEILVLEEKENGRSWASWQMIGKELTSDEDPILAVQQELLIRTGCTCKDWIYLGTFVMDAAHEIGAGHFFCAKTVKKVTKPNTTHSQQLKWVAKREMKQALLDGRIAVLNHAVAVSLAMVMCEDLA